MNNVDELVQQARAAARAGNALVARGYWRRASRLAPERLDIWLSLLEVTDTPAERKRCLERIIEIDPSNAEARFKLEEIQQAEKAAADAAALPKFEPVPAADNGSQPPPLAMRPDVTDEMRRQWDRALAEGRPLVCINHPQAETTLRCNSCGAPICARCAVRTPVGFRCRACIQAQQAVFYNAQWIDYPIAAIIAIVLSAPASVLAGLAGWWFALIISPIAGGLIGGVVHWAVGRRRGRWTWLTAAVGIVIGALGTLVAIPGAFISLGIYVVLATGAAISVLRLGKR